MVKTREDTVIEIWCADYINKNYRKMSNCR